MSQPPDENLPTSSDTPPKVTPQVVTTPPATPAAAQQTQTPAQQLPAGAKEGQPLQVPAIPARGLTPPPASKNVVSPRGTSGDPEEKRLREILAQVESGLKSMKPAPTIATWRARLEALNNAGKPLDRTSDNLFLIKSVLPSATTILLRRADYDTETQREVMSFFQQVLNLVNLFSKEDFTELYKSLSRILNKTKPFYTKMMMPHTTDIYVENLDFFWHQKGFEGVVERVEEMTSRTLSLPCVYAIVKAFANLKITMRLDLLVSYVEKLWAPIYVRMSGLTAEDIRVEPKSVIYGIMETFAGLLRHVNIKPGRAQDDCILSVGEKCFKCQYLEKRIAGINDIKELVANVHRREEYGRRSKFVSQPEVAYNVYIPSRDLIEWLEQVQIVETLFGPAMHVELIRRSADIFVFLAQEHRLTRKHLEIIWNASVGTHETVVSCVVSLLSDLHSVLTIPDIEFILDRVKNLPFTAYTTHHCQLLYTMCMHHCDKSPQVATICCDILWDMTQDKTPISADLAQEAHSNLSKLILYSMEKKQKPVFVERCIENLRNHVSVPQSLLLLQKITGEPEYYSKKVNPIVSEELVSLEKRYNLLALFFQDLKFWQDRVIEAASHHPAEKLLNTQMPGTKKTFSEHLQERLAFLQFVIVNSPIVLEKPHIEEYWDTLITRSVVLQEKDFAFTWLEQTLNQNHQAFADSGRDFITLEKFGNFDFTDATDPCCSCMTFFFKHTNWAAKRLEYKTVGVYQNISVMHVCALDLQGVDILWRLALEAKKQSVGDTTIELLLSLQENLNPKIKAQTVAVRNQFVTQCMGNLSATVQALSSPSATDITQKQAHLKMQRILQSLKVFVDKFEQKSPKMQRHGSRCRGGTLPLSITVLATKKSFDVKMRENDTVLQLKTAISAQCGMAVNVVRLMLKTKELYGDETTLASHHLQPGTVVRVFKRYEKDANGHSVEVQPQAAKAIPELTKEEEAMQPSTILAQEQHFAQLFNVLNFADEKSGEITWDLLNSLPTNDTQLGVLAAVAKMSTAPNWEELLDTRSLFKLLYSLVIIESFLDESDDTKEENDRVLWRAKFQQFGLHYLISRVLMTINFGDVSLGSKRRACLAKLLKVINYFVYDTANDTIKEQLLPAECNLTTLVEKSLHEIHESASHPLPPLAEGISEDGEVALYSMTLFVGCILKDPHMLQLTLARGDFDSWLSVSLLHTTDSHIRQAVFKGFYKLCTMLPTSSERLPLLLSEVMLAKLLDRLPTLDVKMTTCEQYFAFLAHLVEDACKTPEKVAAFAPLMDSLVKMIKEHPIVETRNGTTQDLFLMGLLKVTTTLLKHSEEFKMRASTELGLLEEVYHKCLFDIPTINDHGALAPPKCKTKEARQRAFALLEELCVSGGANFKKVFALVDSQNPPAKRTFWNYAPGAFDKPSSGYVGLKNLGATCYMNSLLQQLYMHTAFRYSLLQSKIDPATNLEESILYHIQKLFSALQESEKKFLDTRPLCNAIKRDGAPLNTLMQMDVDEFFAQLFDTLETELKKGGNEDILQKYFSGTVCHQIVSKQCQHVSEREENFFTLALELKGKKTVAESLVQYIEGDQLNGDNKYFCESCSAKVDAVKRCCLSKLPASLVIHSKRFEFDFELMRRIKVNDLYEFPMKLNVEPYTKEGLARRERKEQEAAAKAGGATPATATTPEEPVNLAAYDYDLVGVLVHSGTADSGHYYSYIRERDTPAGCEPKWFQFNDTTVEPFDPAHIAAQCFGGTDMMSSWDMHMQQFVSRNSSRFYNAYMLFYDKSDVKHPPPSLPPSQLIPTNIYQSLWEDNTRLLQEKNIFDPDYTSFIFNVLTVATKLSPDDDATLTAGKAGTRFLFDTLGRSRDRTKMPSFVELLKTLYSRNAVLAEWLITEMLNDSNTLKQLLLDSPADEVRDAFEELIIHSISVLAPANRPLYNHYSPFPPKPAVDDSKDAAKPAEPYKHPLQPPIPGIPDSLTIKFMDMVLSLQSELAIYWRSFVVYFRLFLDFAKLGLEEQTYLTERHVVGQLLDFYMGDESPHAKLHGGRRVRMGDKLTLPNFHFLFSFVALMVAESHKTEMPHITLSSDEGLILSLPRFYSKSLRETNNPDAMAQIIQCMCENNEDLTQTVIRDAKMALGTVDGDSLKVFLAALSGLMQINDPLRESRVTSVTSSMLSAIQENVHYPQYSAQCMQWFVEAVKTDSLLKVTLWNNRRQLENMLAAAAPPDNVREMSFVLLKSLTGITVEPPNSPEDPAQVQTLNDLFEELLALCPTAQKSIWPERTKYADEVISCTWKLVHFGRLLNWCFRGPSQYQIFVKALDEFYALFFKMDSVRQDLDENKIELNKLWLSACEKIPEVMQHLVDSESLRVKFADFYVAIRPSRDYIKFNAVATPLFYRVMVMICKLSPEFLAFIGFHNNFDWACNFLFMACCDYPETAEALFEVISMASSPSFPRGAEFRTKHIPMIATHNNMFCNSAGLLRVLKVLIQSEADQILYCRGADGSCAALAHILKFIKQKLDDHPALASNIEVLSLAVDVLSQATQWLNSTSAELADTKKQTLDAGNTIFTGLNTCLHILLKESATAARTSPLPTCKYVAEQCSTIIQTFCRQKESCMNDIVSILQKIDLSTSDPIYISFGQEVMKIYIALAFTKLPPNPNTLAIAFDYLIESSTLHPHAAGGLKQVFSTFSNPLVQKDSIIVQQVWANSMRLRDFWHGLVTTPSTHNSILTDFFVGVFPLVCDLMQADLKIQLVGHIFQQIFQLTESGTELHQEEPIQNLVSQLQACAKDTICRPVFKEAKMHTDLLQWLLSETESNATPARAALNCSLKALSASL
ncbi:Ubiquitin carboxyl-terminal hydrolase 34 [Pelomyxa schiedti]|nr:Ubiquitin carboxyl-terminal hydrolase 34 [Pelomyxa schiedti]